ncbi:MAG: hypothetical protein IPO60_16965 [Flavobacteriales bacterium]|jgi:hypothetical protein|nr:hypothetical protein [Flavobacteriales bacterium]MBK7249009.1 hypothetical protein [Flavobacteriales bacterium]MBK9058750.1 hypothetical protein [Flavobacteriales bacterium]MBK9599954.1 hypothetical protein [Flavobacteriales bacterium]QQS71257.1 MAG: hypothetical protein IPP95_08585 [Flavobacteriales bacterium]
MRLSITLLVSACWLLSPAHAQEQRDSVRYSGGFVFHDGIYLDFQAFRNNAPSVPMAALTTAQDQRVTDLASTNGKLFYTDSAGQSTRLDLDRTWGFCDKGIVYVRAGNDFSRIGLMGTLAHLVFDATYHNFDPYMYNGGSTYTVEEQRFLNMETGAFLTVTAGGIYQAISRDAILKEDFDALSRKQRNKPETVFLFMRRYNDRHPLYFPR